MFIFHGRRILSLWYCLCFHYIYSFLATPLSGRPLSVLGVNCRHILLYNLGLQQLYGGHPWGAFDSLLEVVQVFHGNPRLWLRLAEACITAHAKVSPNQCTLTDKQLHIYYVP